MEIYDVTDDYAQFLSQQKQTLQSAKLRQGQRPHDRPSRETSYTGFMLNLVVCRARTQHLQQNPEGKLVHSSFIPPAYLPCTKPVAELTRIAIRDLQLEIHHRGTYLLLRSITPPSRMTAVMAIAEDEDGEVVVLQLYQQENEESRKAVDIVNVGTILLVKEPYFKVMADGQYGVRVDHISDFIRVDWDDEKVPNKWRPRITDAEITSESLKARGNLAVGEGRYWDAITE